MGVVTQGIIDMPFEMAMSDELMRRQFYSAVRDEIATLQAENARLREALERAKPYVWASVQNDGGVENCQIEYRVDYEAITAALGGIND